MIGRIQETVVKIGSNTKINITKFLQGIYLIKLQSKNTVIIKKIIKQ